MNIEKKAISFRRDNVLNADILDLRLCLSDRARSPEIKTFILEMAVEPLSGFENGEILGLAGALEFMAMKLKQALREGKFKLKPL